MLNICCSITTNQSWAALISADILHENDHFLLLFHRKAVSLRTNSSLIKRDYYLPNKHCPCFCFLLRTFLSLTYLINTCHSYQLELFNHIVRSEIEHTFCPCNLVFLSLREVAKGNILDSQSIEYCSFCYLQNNCMIVLNNFFSKRNKSPFF